MVKKTIAVRVTVRCTCTHAKTRHRGLYGEPHTGACRDCSCQQLDLKAEVKRSLERCRYQAARWARPEEERG